MKTVIEKFKWSLLVTGDIAALYLALWATLVVEYGNDLNAEIWREHLIPFSVLYGLWLIIFYIFGLYDARLAKNNMSFYTALLKSLGAGTIIGVFFFYLTPFVSIAPKTNFLLTLIFVFIIFSAWRQFFNKIVQYPLFLENIIIIGNDEESRKLAELVDNNPQLGYITHSIVSAEDEHIKNIINKDKSISTVVVGVNLNEYPELKKALYAEIPRLKFLYLPGFYEKCTQKIPLSQIDETWFMENLREGDRKLYEILKRGEDIFFGVIVAILFFILFPLIAFLIKWESKGPIFYRQERVGKNKKVFNVVKYRSMVENAERFQALWAQKNDDRITRVGKFLRKTYLDELPQFINILKGDMAIVGPRPERPEFVEQLQEEIPFYNIRHIVKPGLTGWAQIKYKYGNSNEGALEKLQYELYYIKNRSLLMDIKIILKTINKITRKGHL